MSGGCDGAAIAVAERALRAVGLHDLAAGGPEKRSRGAEAERVGCVDLVAQLALIEPEGVEAHL